MSNDNTVGSDLFASNKNKNKAKGSYKEPVKSNESYTGIEEIISLEKERGTMKMPLEQKLEFEALLEVSIEHNYQYELFADLVYRRVSGLPREEREIYNEILDRKKKEEIFKLKNKQNKKPRK